MVLQQKTFEEVKKHYPEIPLGRAADLTGKVYGRLEVLYRTQGPEKEGYWICKCQCGNYCLIRARCLKQGSTTSCGCYSKEIRKTIPRPLPEDLTGKHFGQLTVLNHTDYRNKRHYWLCQCSCGVKKEVAGRHLREGVIKSCGCLSKELTRERYARKRAELIGKKFGHLTIIEDMGYRSSEHQSLSKCICDCGRQVIVSNGNLKNGTTRSCGCINISYGEEIISDLLKENNISFVREYTPIELGFKGRYDFAILNSNQEVLYFIEYDGRQHFDSYVGKYERNREYDIVKNDYCYETGIPLIRIPYTVRDIIIDDLRLETSQYIMSEAKEKEYYAI